MPLAIAMSALAYFPLSENAIAQTPEQQQAIEEATIERVQQFGLPTPSIEKITLIGEYGLATWLAGAAGGMVALIDRGDSWEAIALPGGLPTATDLSDASGIPLDIAEQLLERHFEGDY